MEPTTKGRPHPRRPADADGSSPKGCSALEATQRQRAPGQSETGNNKDTLPSADPSAQLLLAGLPGHVLCKQGPCSPEPPTCPINAQMAQGKAACSAVRCRQQREPRRPHSPNALHLGYGPLRALGPVPWHTSDSPLPHTGCGEDTGENQALRLHLPPPTSALGI